MSLFRVKWKTNLAKKIETMKMKTRFKLVQITWNIWLFFWITETLFFTIRDGWHWRAISEDEKTCDFIVSLIMMLCIVLFVSLLYDIVKMFIQADITSVSITKAKQELE